MQEHFKDLLEIEDVQGVLFLDFDGKVIFSEFLSRLPAKLEAINWLLFIHTLNGVQEAELVFENRRCYLRRTATGLIFVVMGGSALTEMVRLNCDILLPVFEHQPKKREGLGRFFKRRT